MRVLSTPSFSHQLPFHHTPSRCLSHPLAPPQTELTSSLLVLPPLLVPEGKGVWGDLGRASCQGLTLSSWCAPSSNQTQDPSLLAVSGPWEEQGLGQDGL